MRTAVVHDWLTGMRGGERVLEALLPLVPEPTIFTLFHSPGSVSAAIESRPIRTSALDRLPFARSHYRNFLPFFPGAVERFDLSGFDLVVSSSHCVAKGAIAPAGVPHLCYCHTPVRYAYEQFHSYFPRDRTRFFAVKRRLVERLREWDQKTAVRPTAYLANSSAVAERIRRHYGREAEVCHPPVDLEFFSPSDEPRRDFLLAVGALVPYKRFDLAIEAAELARTPLVVVGRGSEGERLSRRAGRSVRWAGEVAREELRQLYRTCRFFVQPGEEDFGIAAAEAVACGAPVAALARGGVLDIVRDGAEGVLYDEESAAGLARALERGESLRFPVEEMRRSAERFSIPRFRDRFGRAVEQLMRGQSTRR